MTKDEAIALLMGDFGPETLKTTARYVAPLFWQRPEKGHLRIMRNGSIFFLRPESVSFAVTSNHVFQAYIRDRESTSNITCQIGDMTFSPEERLIESSDELDIATFRVSSSEVSQLNKMELTIWPPRVPEEGKGILFAGFPGHERFTLSSHEFSFGIYAALGTATSISDRDITCQFERENWIEISGFQVPPEGYDLGGMSGAPLLTVIERSDLWIWTLGGVIREFNQPLEILRASRADRILPDGRLVN